MAATWQQSAWVRNSWPGAPQAACDCRELGRGRRMGGGGWGGSFRQARLSTVVVVGSCFLGREQALGDTRPESALCRHERLRLGLCA